MNNPHPFHDTRPYFTFTLGAGSNDPLDRCYYNGCADMLNKPRHWTILFRVHVMRDDSEAIEEIVYRPHGRWYIRDISNDMGALLQKSLSERGWKRYTHVDVRCTIRTEDPKRKPKRRK